jgi:hypothetical protein
MTMNQVRKIVMKKIMTRRAHLNMFELRRRKDKVTGSGQKLATILLSTPSLKTVEFVMTYCQNLKQNHHLNSLFFRIYGTFEKIFDETSEYARVQLNNPKRKKLKDDEKWFESVWQCKQCGAVLHIDECF